MASPGSPRIAITIPAERDPVLLNEAIQSALGQETEVGFVVAAVAGAGATTELRDVLAGWRSFCPERFHAVVSAASGLAAARNGGFRYVLDAFPDLEGIFLLSPEDRLQPNAVACLSKALDDRPDVGWFYPAFNNFGFDRPSSTPGPYSLAVLARTDLAEAGILLRPRVLRASMPCHESVPDDLANWDLALRCAASGTPGAALGAPLVDRRRRAEKIGAGSSEPRRGLPEWLRARHGWLRDSANLAALWAAQAPNFLVHFPDRGRTALFTDPNQLAHVSPADLERRVFGALESPAAIALPPVWIVADPYAWDVLSQTGLLQFALHDICAPLADNNRASLSLVPDDLGRFRYLPADGNPDETAGRLALLAVPLSLVRTALSAEYGRELIEALTSEEPEPGSHRTIAMPPDLVLQAEGDLSLRKGLGALLTGLADSRYRNSPWLSRAAGEWTGVSVFPQTPAEVPYPIGKTAARPDIGFALPHFDFGGVEKVASAVAHELRRAGFRTHLFLIGGNPITPSAFTRSAFDSLNWVLADDAFRHDGPAYLGARTTGWRPDGRERARVVGQLSWLDVLINAQSGAVHEVMDDLQGQGVLTVAHEHVIERSPYGRPFGPPHSLLAYEARYHLVATCSEALSEWLHAQGVPAEKLVAVPNQPGYPIAPGELRELLEKREAESEDGPLRVLFLGRFDRQKGIDRLLEIVAELEGDGAFVWTVAGKAVIDGDTDNPRFSPSVRLLPPVYSGEELTRLYASADVLLLPSRFEGLPLTILEAQRCGCCLVATDVGANGEAIRDGETGFLISERNCVSEAVRVLRRLAQDRALLGRVSQAASGRQFDWASASADLVLRLRAALDEKRRWAAEPKAPHQPSV